MLRTLAPTLDRTFETSKFDSWCSECSCYTVNRMFDPIHMKTVWYKGLSQHDAGVFACTTLYRKMIQKELLLPPNEPLPGRQQSMPYVFLGDDAFPLSSTLLKPYSGNHAKGSIDVYKRLVFVWFTGDVNSIGCIPYLLRTTFSPSAQMCIRDSIWETPSISSLLLPLWLCNVVK